MASSLAHAGVLNVQALALSPASCTTPQNAVRFSTGVAPASMKHCAPKVVESRRRRFASVMASADGNSSYRELETVAAGTTEQITQQVLGGEIFRPMQVSCVAFWQVRFMMLIENESISSVARLQHFACISLFPFRFKICFSAPFVCFSNLCLFGV